MNDQRSTHEQLVELIRLANDNGLYDAADYVARCLDDPSTFSYWFGLDPVHNWFGLTYASYLVLARSLLQSMPLSWQWRFVACLNELDDRFGTLTGGNYTVQLRDKFGRFVKDEMADYNRGRRVVEPQNDSPENNSLLSPAVMPTEIDFKKPTNRKNRPRGMA